MAVSLRSYVEAIGGTPLPYGILGASCATITDVTEDRIHELNGTEWLALGCCPVQEGYGGVGTLHVPAAGLAALLGCCNILREDPATGSLRTLAGNCAIIGAGYSALNTGPGGTPADPGTAWLYITGPLVIRRGPVDTIPGQPGQSVNTRTNDRRVLVERTYVVGTTCTVCAIQIEVCA